MSHPRFGTRQTVDRIGQIPVVAREVWQGAIVLMPAWIAPGDVEPFRPFGAVWVSCSTGRLTMELEPAADAHGPELLLAGLLRFAQQERKVLGGRARRLQVMDPATRDWLQEALGAAAEVECVERLETLDAAVTEYTALVTAEQPPSALEGRDVTIEALECFADAAARYFQAAPWQHLSDEDLVEIEAPDAPEGHRYALVLGNGGHVFGLAFYASRKEHAALRHARSPRAAAEALPVARSVLFDSADGIPIREHDLWLTHRLALAGPQAYPFAARYPRGGKIERPNRDELEFAEAVLRALAHSTEDDMDAGRWSVSVTAGGRPTSVRLALPGLLEPDPPGSSVGPEATRRSFERVHGQLQRFLEEHEFATAEDINAALADQFNGLSIDEMASGARTPEERAQDLAYRAYDWNGRKRIVLAKQALALWPDCAEAWIILAEHAPTPELALERYEQAVAAGSRALGEKLEAFAGELWGHVEARPYLRARLELAQTLEQLGRADEAMAGMGDVLRLNPGDNQGARYLLLPLLLEHSRHDQAAALLDAYPAEHGATMQYCRALLAFQTGGDTDVARGAVAAALRQNRFVPTYLFEPVDDDVDSFRPGSKDEGIVAANEMLAAWEATPGALDWLERVVGTLRAEKRAATKLRKKKGRPSR
jgi:tetratricopeptide (TPR) repeat protein